jgi:two-component system chemotaxis response regulator CheB
MIVRVLVVDDSATMRGMITATLRADPEIKVVGQAADPHEARQLIKQLAPDVVTLDIEMPNMDGLAFLEKIMRLRPMPVIMVSSLTQAGARINLKALEMGAFDCIAKTSFCDWDSFGNLAEKVKAAARSRRRTGLASYAIGPCPDRYCSDGRLVAIGSSTGGVEALITILSKFPNNCPPTIISQHMPQSFTTSFAARLNKLSAATVSEAAEGSKLQAGHVYLAPGDFHLEIFDGRVHLTDAPKVNGHRPSVDVMFYSVQRSYAARSLGVILTGLGRDGAEGLLALRQAGAETIGQDEASCVVYGMPRAALEIGAVMRQLPLEHIADRILLSTNAHQREFVG